MGNLTGYYNPQALPPKESNAGAIPRGIYVAKAEDAKLQNTNKGNGAYVWIQWRIQGPSYANAVVFDRINIANESIKAQEIGRQTMSQLQAAIGIYIEDTSQIIGKTCQIKVGIEKQDANSEYEPGNNVRDYMPLASSSPAPAAPAPAAPAYQQAAPVNPPAPMYQAAAAPSMPQQSVASTGTRKSWQRG